MQNKKRKLMPANTISKDARKKKSKRRSNHNSDNNTFSYWSFFYRSNPSPSVERILELCVWQHWLMLLQQPDPDEYHNSSIRAQRTYDISFIILLFISGCVLLVSLRIYLPVCQFIACVAHTISTLGTCLYCNQNWRRRLSAFFFRYMAASTHTFIFTTW